MGYKPKSVIGNPHASFVCPECGQRWVLAGVGPGNYWEPRELRAKEVREMERIIEEYKNKE